MAQDTFKTLKEFTPSPGKTAKYHSLAALEAAGFGKISRLPRSIRVVLEALMRTATANVSMKNTSRPSPPGSPRVRAPWKSRSSSYASCCRI